MLQEATKIIQSAFHDSFIKRLSLYLHDCVREEVQSSTFRNLKQDKDNKWIFLKGEEQLFTHFEHPLMLDGSDSDLTELMIQSEMSQKDKYLIYGHLFLVGKNSKSKRKNEFLTPLLYTPCRLERDGVNISCTLQDDVMSLNTGALTALMRKSDDEDEMEHMLDGLLEVVPELPLTQEKLNIFLTTLKSILPDVDISLNHEDDDNENFVKDDAAENFYQKIDSENVDDFIEDSQDSKPSIKLDKVSVTNQSAIILTKRPSITAGVLHELTQIAEKPSGVFRETALSVVNDEYLRGIGKLFDKSGKEKKELKDFAAVTPLSLSDSQEDVIRKIEQNPLLAVYGPPGTGKSQTIVNLVAHLVANGKTVLVASRMDKAVDVVAQRLNELGAPFLALRAGRLNYQKQLSFQLQDLIANKIDIDTGYEEAILVDVEDMYALLNAIKELENKCEKIIELEKNWQEVMARKLALEADLGEKIFINKKLKKDEVDEIKKVLSSIEKNLEKSGLFSSISNSLSAMKLKKILNISSLPAEPESIMRLSLELQAAEMECEARMVETRIHKIGNIHQILGQIKQLKKKQKGLAVDILKNKRRESLKGLLRDQIKRQRLIVHTKAIVERKKNLQNRLLEEEDFTPLLEAFPCWCVTTYAISGSLPMKSGLFDVAIIDEASQCDIASCFPILFRAKKAVIVGDDKQLPHLSFLEKAKEQSFLSQYNIPDKYQLMWRFRTNSMFDLANYYSTNPVLLDEHFRSYYPIIQFSNQEFYGNRIRIMTKDSGSNDVLELHLVTDGKVDSDATRNMPEVEAVVKRIHELILQDEGNEDNPVSIGVVSPFRGQVDLIGKALRQVLTESTIRRHQIEVGTAHTFQGDERDVMIFSLAVADNSFAQSLTFLQKPNLFNVAITRARKKLITFLSRDPKSLPAGLLKDYIEYTQNYIESAKEDEFSSKNKFKNSFEQTVAQALIMEGLEVKAGFEAAGVYPDIMVKDEFNNEVIVEIDGVEDNLKSNTKDIKKQTILERAGYKVVRMSFREWEHSSQACIDRVKQILVKVD
ncbi:MAG TPA: AAA family ATPase [Candidatus Limenecus avicola]|uniref:AAA family ATPase n=1 Tax=Candidatus Limenecus avicola TaxID=2840847 RepID=A0A9D1SSQ6_9CLOT|nr:AAA family ATPase [Candidatus Limenecus avicola]